MFRNQLVTLLAAQVSTEVWLAPFLILFIRLARLSLRTNFIGHLHTHSLWTVLSEPYSEGNINPYTIDVLSYAHIATCQEVDL